MNLSGEAAQALMSFYKIPPRNLIVAVDDIYLDVGSVRIRTKGSHGGHNGLRDLIDHCGEDFTLIRIRVSTVPAGRDKADCVQHKYQYEVAKAFDDIAA